MPKVPPIIKQALRVALTAAVLVGVGVYVDLGAVVDTLRSASFPLLVLACLLVVPNIALDAWTWRELLGPMLLAKSFTKRESTTGRESLVGGESLLCGELHSGEALLSNKRNTLQENRSLHGDSNAETSTLTRRLPFRLVLSSVLAGYTAAFFTPARVGEFGGRALTLAPGTIDSFDSWDVSITVGVQRIFDTGVAVSVGWIATAWIQASGLLSPAWSEAALVGLWIGGAVVAMLAATIACPGWIGSLLHTLVPSATGMRERAESLQRIGRRTTLRVAAGCTLRYLVFATQLAVLVRSFAPGASTLDLAVGTGVTYYLKFLIPSLTFLDVGVREGAAILAFGWMNVPEAAALNAALVIFFVNLALPAAVGSLFLKRQTLPEAASSSST